MYDLKFVSEGESKMMRSNGKMDGALLSIDENI